MSPIEHNKLSMTGPRPSPLKINKDSHSIHKPQQREIVPEQRRNQRQPVIIYTESPKVIHAQPKDFMALVQRLTGLEGMEVSTIDERRSGEGGDGHDGVDRVSATANSNAPGDFVGRGRIDHDYSRVSSNFNNVSCSPMGQFRLQDSAFPSPNMVNSLLTPSFMDFMKRLT